MSSREEKAKKSLEVALDHALARLNQIEGKNRIALASEYKEWLADDELKEKAVVKNFDVGLFYFYYSLSSNT